ncbi:MAG: patatin-like phospholipase family protein [Methylobacteriaceae bacterium]|nr:patatin-like phospholipase family protein [Methylobacteriaceae bacterium]
MTDDGRPADLPHDPDAPGTAHAPRALPPFLSALDPAVRQDVLSGLEPISVPGGHVLFEEGDPPDALYAVVSGALGISVRDVETGASRRLARVGPPDTVGEMALLSDAPHSATVTALRDAHLLRLSRETFGRLLERHPAIALYFARLLADRLRASARPAAGRIANRAVTFAVLPLTDGVDATGFGYDLASALGPEARCLAAWPPEADETWFHETERTHGQVVYVGQSDPGWSRLCLRRADHVVFLARAGAPLLPDSVLDAPLRPDWTRTDLVLVQENGGGLPRAPHASLGPLATSLAMHLRPGEPTDRRRVARLVSGQALGIVLSGGGARGFAHLGVLKALSEAGYEFDHVGGTSIGAVVAAGYAMGWGERELQERIIDAFVSDHPLNDYTVPIVALTRGAKVDARLRRHFGSAALETLWLPFFCISSNLSSGSPRVHRSGDVATALRASVAIPGLLPPVLASEGVLVDGAMMNNLPVDVMADMGRGRVLAVDVAGDLAFQSGPVRRPRWSRWLRSALDIPDAMPGIAAILLRAATVSSDAQAAMTRSRASVVIRPPLAGVDLRSWRSHASIAALGYDYARRLIDIGAFEPGEMDAPAPGPV